MFYSTELCEIKEISPLYRLFNEYKNQELMFTVIFFILLMYLEEFLFAFRKIRKNDKNEFSIFFCRISTCSFGLCPTIYYSNNNFS